jgi:penicillin-binding protein A
VNRQITRLAVASIGLISALIIATTYWQTWAVAGLEARQDNAIQRVAEFTIDRGRIYASDGKTVLAKNVRRKVKGKKLFYRRYPHGTLAPHVVGYASESRSRAGIERSVNDYLTGANGDLRTVAETTLDQLKGVTVKGNDLVLTLDVPAQRAAVDALEGLCGAAVALDPKTGRVLALASSPTFNSNAVANGFNRIRKRKSKACSYAAPLLDRATQGLYPPGSTFKVVTASAALDSGAYTPESEFVDPGYCIEYGKRVSNAGNPEIGPEIFGTLSLFTALQHSVNSVFCNIGKKIGAGKIIDYSRKFGFYDEPGIDLPLDAQSPSGLYKGNNLFLPKRPATQVDPGRLAFGQERLLVTPLQMAMVAGTLANNGVLMRPHLVDQVRTREGKVVTKTKPQRVRRVVSPKVAREINEMMQAAVTSGTGTRAQIPGVAVAGKTGTAETGVQGRYTTWFITFAPADKPKVAVAVALENQQGFGGTTAAPIAKEIMEAILRKPSNT